jgi:hypothetical protein
MRFGFALPQVGVGVGPEGLVTVAKRAEELGFDSLWVLDRKNSALRKSFWMRSSLLESRLRVMSLLAWTSSGGWQSQADFF